LGCAPDAQQPQQPEENEPLVLKGEEQKPSEPMDHMDVLNVLAPATLDTFIAQSLQIDQLDQTTGSLNPADANLFASPGATGLPGLDPADGTASVDFPTGGPSTWIDWNDLGATPALLNNHRLMDTYPGKDPSAFPMNNECVGPANVLTKMDLTYIASANNNRYAYLAVQRSGNNGDAGYYWIFTKLAPNLVAGEAPCGANQQRLTYDISVGDVLLGGHFSNNGTPLLTAYVARINSLHVDAKSAIDFSNTTLWQANPSMVAAVAVNQTPTAPGSFGSAGVNALTGGNLQAEIFAEAAVNLNLFTGGASSCGQTYYGSVITRSSGSGGTTPDLKDLAGPAIFNFSGIVTNPTATTGCSNSVHIDAHAARPDGSAIPGVTCSWTLDSGSTPVSGNCIDDITVPADGLSHTLHVSVNDPATSCAASAATAPFTVGSAITAAATLTPECTGHKFDFSGTGSGGIGTLSYSWAFSGPGSVTPTPSATSQSGTATTSVKGSYSATLTVTDSRGCSGTDTKSIDVADDLTAGITTTRDCNLSFTYAATGVGGGTGTPAYAWSFSAGVLNPSTLTGPSGSANVSAAGDYDVHLTVTDARGCTASPSATVHPFAPLTLSLGFSAQGPVCITNSSAVTFNASAGGGSGSGAYSWTGTGCGNVASCPYDNANDCATQPVSVSFTDPICGSIGPASLTYTKTTTVTVQ
jgi:hypothetical protein